MRFLLMAVLGLLTIHAEAASFDCAKATTKVEKTICENDDLSRLDQELDTAYRGSLSRDDVKRQAIKSQRDWLKNVRNPCQNAECLKQAYESRIKEIGLMSSFGIVIMSAPVNGKVQQMPSTALVNPPVANVSVTPPPSKERASQVVVDSGACAQPPAMAVDGLSGEKAVSQLLGVAKAEFEQGRFGCAVFALERANSVAKSIIESSSRAISGMEIKDAVWDALQRNVNLDAPLKKRFVTAAVQSLDANGSIQKNAGEDERVNDTAFYGLMADTLCADKGFLLKMSNCEYRDYISNMFLLDFSLPPTQRYVEQWRYSQYLQEMNLLEISKLWEAAPEEYRISIEAALANRLGQPIQSYVMIGFEWMAPEKARDEAEGLKILQPAIERVQTKQRSDFWAWWVYRYMAEAYWQAGDKAQGRVMFEKARESIKAAKSTPAVRVGPYMHLVTSLCKSIMKEGKVVMACPVGIYDAQELSALIDELEEMAKANSDSYALGRVGVLKKRLSDGGVK